MSHSENRTKKMTLEEIRGSDNAIDRFPIGMRVLAVDDNPTCLKILEGLLKKCQYQVTTTNQAITALNMLRENRNRFDLVISDVYMPDMDGFKLLELVGLEMDLPVIMLSGNGDSKLVMKGVTHGACDYLVKPVRLEEIRNIWQHVIRRKVASKSKNNREKLHQRNESGNPTTKKKPRVVWSFDLHGKFVDAIKQLGIENAVPKRILDLMNVEGLTRQNVANHLQVYRHYLKRISNKHESLSQTKQQPVHQNMSLLQGMPPSFELDQLQYNNTQVMDFNSIQGSRIFTGTNLPNLNSIDERRVFRGSNTFIDPFSVLANQGSVKLPSTGTESFNLLSSNGGFLLVPSNLLPVGENHTFPAITNSSVSSNLTTTASVPIEAHAGGLVGDVVQNVNRSLSSQKGGLAASAVGGYAGLSGLVGHSRPNGGGLTLAQTEQTKLQSGFVSSNGYGSLYDIKPALLKQKEQNTTMLMGGGFGYDDEYDESCS